MKNYIYLLEKERRLISYQFLDQLIDYLTDHFISHFIHCSVVIL